MTDSRRAFNFLANCFLYPQQEIALHGPQVLRRLAQDMDKEDPEDMREVSFGELEAEYVRLFVNAAGGAAAPPYASVYRHNSGMLMQQGYEEALAFYRMAGLRPCRGPEPADHLAHELAFVSLLLDEDMPNLLKSFLGEHLLEWYPAFSSRLEAADPHPFYRELCQVTGMCLIRLSEEVSDEETRFSEAVDR